MLSSQTNQRIISEEQHHKEYLPVDPASFGRQVSMATEEKTRQERQDSQNLQFGRE